MIPTFSNGVIGAVWPVLIAVWLNTLTGISLGGLPAELRRRVLSPAGVVLPGLVAADEVSGFGGRGPSPRHRAGGGVSKRLRVLRAYGRTTG